MNQAALTSVSPQNPADLVGRVSASSPDQVRAAVERARAAQREWAQASPAVRSAALNAVADALAAASDEFAELIVREVGKPVGEAAGEVLRGVAILRYYAQQAFDPDGETYPSDAGTLLMSRSRPHGVAGLITPWNFPLAIPLWKAAPALAFGNSVVLKPAEQSPVVAVRLGHLFAERLPADVVTVVPGDGTAGRALVDTADCVSFTGSVAVGEQVRAAAVARGVPVQCEMGGHNPSIVLADADPAAAAATIAAAAMGYAGQKCTATSRVIVVGDPDEFTQALAAAIDNLAVGDPMKPDTVVGPVISEAARTAVVDAATRAQDDGGRIVRGGRALDLSGYFVAPTLITGLPADHPVNQREVFGPICTVLAADNDDHAVALANGVPYGLVGAVFTRDLDRALRLVGRLDTGMARVNAATSGVDFYAPFGGAKISSYGPREQGKAARAFYTRTQTVTIAASSR
ncbi:MAG TPA: aldehyde dehydrogenase family protein [Micromonosporaceae bacterium]